MKYKYDAFISYRRDPDFTTAELLLRELEKRGYRVFLDTHETVSGKFPERLRTAVKDSEHLILILSSHTLQRCSEPGDWVAEEISIALGDEKNIIPVTTSTSFEFPDHLPDVISELRNYQRVQLNAELFDASIDNLIKVISKNGFKAGSSRNSIGEYIRVFLMLMLVPVFALVSFFVGRYIARVEIGNKEDYIVGTIAEAMTPEYTNGHLVFNVNYKGKSLTYDPANDSIWLSSIRDTSEINRFNKAEIILGSAFIANAGMWAYLKTLPSKFHFLRTNKKAEVIVTTGIIIIASSGFIGYYSEKSKLKNPLESGDIDLLKRNTISLRKHLFELYWGYSEKNNFNDFDIDRISSPHLKEAVQQSHAFYDSIHSMMNDGFIPSKEDFENLFTRLSLYEYLNKFYFNYANRNMAIDRPRFKYGDWINNPEIIRIHNDDNIRVKYYASMVVKVEKKEMPEPDGILGLMNYGLIHRIILSNDNKTLLYFGLLRQTRELGRYFYNKKVHTVKPQRGDILLRKGSHYVLSSDEFQQNVIFRQIMSSQNDAAVVYFRPSNSEFLKMDSSGMQFDISLIPVPIFDIGLLDRIKVVSSLSIANIEKGSDAEKYDLKREDYILEYAGVALTNGDPDMYKEVQQKHNAVLKIVFARKQDDGSFRIFEHTFSSNEPGFRMQESWQHMDEHSKMLEAYNLFKAGN